MLKALERVLPDPDEEPKGSQSGSFCCDGNVDQTKTPIRCPKCDAMLGVIVGAEVVVEMRYRGSRTRRIIIGQIREIHCDRLKLGKPCPGVWQAQRKAG